MKKFFVELIAVLLTIVKGVVITILLLIGFIPFGLGLSIFVYIEEIIVPFIFNFIVRKFRSYCEPCYQGVCTFAKDVDRSIETKFDNIFPFLKDDKKKT